jgi:hypothetical protein
MVIFFGLLALVLSTAIMLKLRQQRAFRGESTRLTTPDGPLTVERKYRVHKGRAQLTLGLAGSRGVEMQVQPEDFFGRLLRSMNVGRDAHVGDRRLDEELLFETDDPRVVRWLQSSPEARAAISALFARGIARLMAYQGRIWVELRKPAADISDLDALSRDLCKSLAQIIASIPKELSGRHESAVFHAGRALALLAFSAGLLVSAVVMLMGQAATRFPQHAAGFQLYAIAHIGSLLFGLLLWWLAARWIKDSARARAVLAELLIVGVSAFSVVGAVSIGQANIVLATAPIVKEIVAIEAVQVTTGRSRRGRRSKSYYVHLPALHEGQIPAGRYRINQQDYHSFKQGMLVEVESRRGLLGYYFVQAPVKAPRR